MGACAPKTKGPGKGPYGTTCPVSPGEKDGEKGREDAGKTGEVEAEEAEEAEETSMDQSGRSSHRHHHRHRRRLDAHGGLDHYWVDPCR